MMYLEMFAFEFLAIHAFDGVVGRFYGVESHECKSPALTRGLHGCECTCEMVCFSVCVFVCECVCVCEREGERDRGRERAYAREHICVLLSKCAVVCVWSELQCMFVYYVCACMHLYSHLSWL